MAPTRRLHATLASAVLLAALAMSACQTERSPAAAITHELACQCQCKDEQDKANWAYITLPLVKDCAVYNGKKCLARRMGAGPPFEGMTAQCEEWAVPKQK